MGWEIFLAILSQRASAYRIRSSDTLTTRTEYSIRTCNLPLNTDGRITCSKPTRDPVFPPINSSSEPHLHQDGRRITLVRLPRRTRLGRERQRDALPIPASGFN